MQDEKVGIITRFKPQLRVIVNKSSLDTLSISNKAALLINNIGNIVGMATNRNSIMKKRGVRMSIMNLFNLSLLSPPNGVLSK